VYGLINGGTRFISFKNKQKKTGVGSQSESEHIAMVGLRGNGTSKGPTNAGQGVFGGVSELAHPACGIGQKTKLQKTGKSQKTGKDSRRENSTYLMEETRIVTKQKRSRGSATSG